MNKYVIYTRVSTRKQGESGLGLDAQTDICKNYISSVNGEIVGEYRDVLSGTIRTRPGLLQAVEHCKAHKATLVIAKLDRLARDVEFTFHIANMGISIHFCDMPEINTMLLGIFATVAQYERELTSKRTKDALKAKKASGAHLGNNKGADLSAATTASAEARRKAAQDDRNNKQIWAILTANGTPSLKDFNRLSEQLNAMEIKTSTGLEFTPARARSAYYNLKNIFGNNKKTA